MSNIPSKQHVQTADIEACFAWLVQSGNPLAASHQMAAMLHELLERRRADETKARLTDLQCRGVVHALETRDWRGITLDDVRMFDQLIGDARSAQETTENRGSLPPVGEPIGADRPAPETFRQSIDRVRRELRELKDRVPDETLDRSKPDLCPEHNLQHVRDSPECERMQRAQKASLTPPPCVFRTGCQTLEACVRAEQCESEFAKNLRKTKGD